MTAGGGLVAAIDVERTDGFRLQISLDVPAGRTAALLGPNGAGKSTTVGALAGLVPLTGGRVVLGGRVLDDPAAGVFVAPEERQTGVVFQDYLLFPHLSVLDNVAFGLRGRRAGRRPAEAAARRWLERLDLVDLAGRRPGDLSGGQAQRVALARALACEPDILLLDEPLAALDVATRAGLRHLLSDHLAAFPGPRLIITHDPTEAFLLADEIHVLESGRVTQTGTADEIRIRPRTRYAAELVGRNLVVGHAAAGLVTTPGHRLHTADTRAQGSVVVTIDPRAVALHLDRPAGSPRNVWSTRVTRMERREDRVRVQTGPPLPLVAEVTPGAIGELGLAEGSEVWVSVKATEIAVEEV